MLELVKMFLMKLPGAAERIVKKNRERLWLRGDAHRAEDVRKCSSYPSKVSTLKGVGGDLIICEEAAAMDTAVFYEVVVPLLELDKTALICISTILDSFNFYSKLLELKDENGDPFFVTHTFVMACDQCQADGTPEKCTHMFHSLPPWQSERKHLKIRAMMADQPELLARETMGLQSDTYQRAFATADLRAFRARPLRPPPSLAVQAVVVAIDPSGGGAKSHVAVVSCYWAAGHVVVAGLESIAARRPEDYETAIRDHVRLLAKTWPHAVLAVCPEANLGFESARSSVEERCVRWLPSHCVCVCVCLAVAHCAVRASRKECGRHVRSRPRVSWAVHDAQNERNQPRSLAGQIAGPRHFVLATVGIGQRRPQRVATHVVDPSPKL